MAFIVETLNDGTPEWCAVDGYVWRDENLAHQSLRILEQVHPSVLFRMREVILE